ncbi:MAG: hypothetical protein SF123_19985 [Chloroflexota bacterium]|nr:hypothetical protein [Chloroflexota bacterium]
MTWNEVRILHPNRWVLLEAINAHSENNRHIVEDMTVAGVYETSLEAWQRYHELHRLYPQRDLFPYHTSHSQIDIAERVWIGVRPAT